jgi:hypothetical protein
MGVNPELIFQIRLFTRRLAQCVEPATTHFRFIQAVHSVMADNYPIEPIAKFALSRIQAVAQDCTNADITPQHKLECKLNYLKAVSDCELYGCSNVFPIYSPTALTNKLLAFVNIRGLYLLQAQTKEVVQQFKLERLRAWDYCPGTKLLLEEGPDTDVDEASGSNGNSGVRRNSSGSLLHTFSTQHGEDICALLRDYAVQVLIQQAQHETQQDQDHDHHSTTENDLIVLFQALYRGFHLRCTLDSQFAAIQIQALFRGYKIRIDLDTQFAAIQIQALYRGYKTRADLDNQFAAIQIQALYRGFRQRCSFDDLINQLEAEYLQLQQMKEEGGEDEEEE